MDPSQDCFQKDQPTKDEQKQQFVEIQLNCKEQTPPLATNKSDEVHHLGGKQKKPSKGKMLIDGQSIAKLKQVLLRICMKQEKQIKLKLVQDALKPLTYNDSDCFKQVVTQILLQMYGKGEKQDKFKHFGGDLPQMIDLYIELAQLFKEGQVTTPIIEALYKAFTDIWAQCELNQRQQLIKVWKNIPYQLLENYLSKFNLLKAYQNQPIDQQLIEQNRMLGDLSTFLFEKKIAQACEYLNLYNSNKNRPKQQCDKLQKFSDNQVIPKLLKNDQIFTPFALNLIAKDKRIKDKILNHAELDPSIAVRIIENINEDVRTYKAVYEYVLHKHYRSIIHQHKSWYIIEDKMSFQKIFIAKFIAEIEEFGENQNKFQLPQNAGERKRIIDSMKFRLNPTSEKDRPKQYVQNPLYELDHYGPAEMIFAKIDHTDYQDEFFRLQAHGITQNKVIFIHQINNHFEEMSQSINKSSAVGFDTQFRCASSKYDQQGIAIIQLALINKCYLIDFLKLENQPKFRQFLIDLLENRKIKKIGHTLSSDFKFLGYTFKTEIKTAAIIDLVEALKAQLIDQKYSSLAFMCDKFVGKKLSKYEQRSNWNRRPLKLCQTHYAASDAYVCLLIYQKLNLHQIKQKQPKNKQNLLKPQIKQNQKIVKPFDYSKWQPFLQNPIFLIDNMLKKLCSIMRNCGLDAQYITVRDHELAVNLASKQSRIIITRDTKFYDKKNLKVPVYLLEQKSDSEVMFKEVVQKFKINLNNFTSLSRCVKCNGPDLVIIDKKEARKEINFKHEDSPIQVFWRCDKCKQIYWEGGQFAKAKERYAEYKK